MKNKIRDIGTKYLGLGLYKLILLTYLFFDIGILISIFYLCINLLKQFLYIYIGNNIVNIGSKYLGLGLSKLIKLTKLDLLFSIIYLQLLNYYLKQFLYIYFINYY